MRVKTTLIAVLAVALVAVLSVGGTMAYLKDTKEVSNVFVVGDLELALAEPDYPLPHPANNSPGDCFPKNPTVTASKGNGFMRVTVEYIDLQSKHRITNETRLALIAKTIYYAADYSSAIPGSAAFPLDKAGVRVPESLHKTEAQLQALVASGKAANYNTAEFRKDSTRSAPGLDYYNYIKAGTRLPEAAAAVDDIFLDGKSAVLFNSIAIPSDWGAQELAVLGSYTIELRAEAIQADGFTTSAAAFDALDNELA